MSEALARYQTGRSPLHSFRPAAVSRGELAVGGTSAPCLASEHRSAKPSRSCRESASPTPGVADDRTNHDIPARLLLISDDRTLPLERLRREFPAPPHRVQVADSVDDGLEHVRTNL